MEKERDEDGQFLTFHLNNNEYTKHYNEIMEAFGWTYVKDRYFEALGILNELRF